MRTAQEIIEELSGKFYSPYEMAQVQAFINEIKGDKKPDESKEYRAWLAWLVESGSEEPYETFLDWIEKDPIQTGAGTTADRVQNFYEGFCANEGNPKKVFIVYYSYCEEYPEVSKVFLHANDALDYIEDRERLCGGNHVHKCFMEPEEISS